MDSEYNRDIYSGQLKPERERPDILPEIENPPASNNLPEDEIKLTGEATLNLASQPEADLTPPNPEANDPEEGEELIPEKELERRNEVKEEPPDALANLQYLTHDQHATDAQAEPQSIGSVIADRQTVFTNNSNDSNSSDVPSGIKPVVNNRSRISSLLPIIGQDMYSKSIVGGFIAALIIIAVYILSLLFLF